MQNAADNIGHGSTRRLLLALAVVLAGHLPRLPLWLTAVLACLFLWRGWQTWRPLPAFPRSLRLLLAVGLLIAVYASYGRINGQSAGVALLIAMLGAKLTELEHRRDHVVMVLFGYFLLSTHFLFTQELVVLPYAAAAVLALGMCLIDLSYPAGGLHWQTLLQRAGKPLLQALPLMLVMFVLFPRIPGPLWGLPSDAGAARSGLSDRMEPGSVGDLALSDEVVFRVEFAQRPPELKQRYWRGPVFWQFDGRAWTEGARSTRMPAVVAETAGPALHYTLTLEPHRQPWLFALDFPVLWPADSGLDAAGALRARADVKNRRRLELASSASYRLDVTLPEPTRIQALQLPPRGNRRSRAFAQQLRAQYASDDTALVRNAVLHFREQAFSYTLQPPRLGDEWIDEFLFDTRRGFCEHYAGSFTFLMRAAGIPARVVTGYQGGERSTLGDYYIVRQSDAHAWAEVWLAGQGWVRVDPTAAVAPERVELNLEQALGLRGEKVPLLSRRSNALYEIRLGWDFVNAEWNRAVLGYGPELQAEVLARLGLIDWTRMVAALAIALCALLGGLGLFLLRPLRAAPPVDPAARAWIRLNQRLHRAGLALRIGEAPTHLMARAMRQWPNEKERLDDITRDYLSLRYSTNDDTAALKRLRYNIRCLRLMRSHHSAKDNAHR